MNGLTPSAQHQGKSTAMPQNNNNDNAAGHQWQLELPVDTNYMDELTRCTSIDDIVEGLPAPSIEPSIAIINQPSYDCTDSQGQRPSTGTGTAKRGGNHNPSRRIYNDEEIRERRAERQRRYRDRQRQEAADVNKQIAETAVQVETARAEQDSLLDQHTVLSKAAEYATASIHAAQSLVSNTINRVQSQYYSAVDGLAWLGLQVYSPSDAQLHGYIDRKNVEELITMSEKISNRCNELFVRWDTEPHARENIEAQLERIRNMRMRCLAYLASTRPRVTVEIVRRRMMPAGPDGAPHPKMVEAVANLNLTPEQLESFEREWVLYLQRTEPIRQEARSLIDFLSSAGAEANVASFCSFSAAGLFLDRLQAVQELELHPSNEAVAIAKLNVWLAVNLEMQQRTVLMRHTMPYYPDVIQIGRIIFGEDYGNTIQAGRVQSLHSDLESS